MAAPSLNIPVIEAPADERVEYLKKVGIYTAASLTIAAFTGIFSAMFIAPAVGYGWPSLVGILGSWGVANWVAPRFVFGAQKQFGLVLASVAFGVAFGWLLLMAYAVSGAELGNPFTLIGQALAAVSLTAFGMVGYLWSNPKDFSFIKAGMAMLGLPMLVLMGITFVFPIGGTLGLVISAGFVVFSVVALLYRLNSVLHEMDCSMHVEAAYLLSMALLTLLWNVLVLLIRLTSRD